jgi:hypothetical protein
MVVNTRNKIAKICCNLVPEVCSIEDIKISFNRFIIYDKNLNEIKR